MRTVVILQARVASTRLPGKVLLDVLGRPMLARQIERLLRSTKADEIVVATTDDEADAPLSKLADECGVRWYRGDADDVLRRFVNAAQEAAADVVVRTTGDCPLIDATVMDHVIDELVTHNADCDYASNVIRRTYPRGLDTEAMFVDVLERMERLATSKPAREHVTVFLRSERRELFVTRDVCDATDNSDLRWTVDDERDLRLIRSLYEQLDLAHRRVTYHEMLAFMRQNPALGQINAGGYTWTPQ
jgi:spore coat polysaccharide biosynthesis protein SpsF